MTIHRLWPAIAAGCCGLLFGVAHPTEGQPRDLTIDEIFDPQRRVDFDGDPPQGLAWLDDDHYLERANRPDANPPLLTVDAGTGQREPFFDVELMESTLAAFPGIGADDARGLSRRGDHLMNPGRTALLVELTNDLYHYDLGSGRVSRLTRSPEPEEHPSFSPDGRFVAFIRDHDLFLVDVDHRRDYALTNDGSDTVRNGLLDWVYQEEIYGRGNFRGYWWSPDSTRIAYLQLDDSDVPGYTIVDHIPYYPEVEEWDYPKAGDPNPAGWESFGRVAVKPSGSTLSSTRRDSL